ncbi:MAG TPA: phosphatase PAP2 family protein [Candidatus Binatia bacterium]|nr:phosphatase PAP2 family protein [Candidatus Binatia bacterium]
MLVVKTKQRVFQILGVAGTAACLAIFIRDPSFPTPDKLIVFLFFVFMIFSQAIVMLLRLGPFVALLLVYESFRGIAHSLNSHVNYTLAPHVDKLLFGNLPTIYLQRWLWRGHTSWYDVVLYVPYMLFFVVPLGLAILVWKTRDSYYWQVVTTYMVVFFSAFLTFLLFPAAPPWLASQNHYIEPIVRISSNVWFSLGINNFPSLYNHIAPNPVAAVPSLHAAVATLFSIFIFKLYGRRWGALSLIYPILIYVGVVYEGEHYAFDVICGITYAVLGYLITPYLISFVKNQLAKHKAPALPKAAAAHRRTA